MSENLHLPGSGWRVTKSVIKDTKSDIDICLAFRHDQHVKTSAFYDNNIKQKPLTKKL